MRWGILLVLFLASCQVATVCNVPYIHFEKGCCLDVDNNSICDQHLVCDVPEQLAPVTNVSVGVRSLEDTAHKVTLYVERSDGEALYDLLTEERKQLMDKLDFTTLYKPVQHGMKVAIAGTSTTEVVKENPIVGMTLLNVREEEDKGYAVFNYTFQENIWFKPEPINFSFQEEWRIEGFDKLLHAGCFIEEHCDTDYIEEVCQDTCYDKKKMDLRENNSFTCKKHVCHCNCFEAGREAAYTLAPEFSS